jgi:hypothetical protein
MGQRDEFTASSLLVRQAAREKLIKPLHSSYRLTCLFRGDIIEMDDHLLLARSIVDRNPQSLKFD